MSVQGHINGGEVGPFLVKHWTTESGLPQSTITAIAQTQEGYMWLGTFGGLARFDGERFKVYNTANTPALKTNRITALHIDCHNILWVGTETGDVMRYEKGTFTSLLDSGSGIEPAISFIYRDRRNALWVGDARGARRFPDARPQANAPLAEAGPNLRGDIGGMAEDSNGALWALFDKTLAVSADGLSFAPVEPDVLAFQLADDGDLWLIKESPDPAGVLGRWSKSRFTPQKTFDISPRFQKVRIMRQGFSPAEWRRGPDAPVWFTASMKLMGFGQGRLNIFDLSRYARNDIWQLFYDREGRLWVGTGSNGLLRLTERRLNALTSHNGLPLEDNLRTIVEAPDGGVWLGGMGGLFYWREGRLTRYTVADGLPDTDVKALAFDAQGALWIATNKGMAQRREGRFSALPDSWGWDNRALFADSRQRMWIARGNAGAQVVENGRAAKTYTARDGLVNDQIRYITETSDGAMWFGTLKGVSRLQNDAFTNYTTANGLTNDYVRDVFEDDDGAVWFATYGGGLNRLKDGRIGYVTTQQGLPDDFISRILPDDDGHLWLLGNRGVYAARRQTLREVAEGRLKSMVCASYGLADGMITSEGQGGHQPAGWRTRDGKLWFPMIQGAVIIEPERLAIEAPASVLEEINLAGQALSPATAVVVEPGQESLEIRYTGLSFHRPEQVRFKYKLEGFDADWVDVGTRRVAYFTGLPPGAYRFSVIAANTDGIWGAPSQSLEIIVKPPFWRRWWFYGLAFLSVTGLIYMGFRARLKALQRARLRQAAFSRQLLNTQDGERKRMAAELHDSLGQHLLVIKNWATFGLEKEEVGPQTRQQLEEISETAALALVEVRQIANNLSPYQLDKAGLSGTLKYMVKKVAKSSDIDIKSEIGPIDGLLDKEGEVHFYRIAQEALNNVIKHSGAAVARVAARRDDSFLLLTVSDDGRGFPAAAANYKQGMGLEGLKARTNMLGGRYEIKSRPGQGTEITVLIPVLRAVENG